MLGYGTALKILFMSPESLELERNEVVALINTAARLSESMIEVRELNTMYWEKDWQNNVQEPKAAASGPAPTTTIESPVESLDILDVTVGVIASLGRENLISLEREKEFIDLAFARHPELLIFGKHYSNELHVL
jgi:hypothetical protein